VFFVDQHSSFVLSFPIPSSIFHRFLTIFLCLSSHFPLIASSHFPRLYPLSFCLPASLCPLAYSVLFLLCSLFSLTSPLPASFFPYSSYSFLSTLFPIPSFHVLFPFLCPIPSHRFFLLLTVFSHSTSHPSSSIHPLLTWLFICQPLFWPPQSSPFSPSVYALCLTFHYSQRFKRRYTNFLLQYTVLPACKHPQAHAYTQKPFFHRWRLGAEFGGDGQNFRGPKKFSFSGRKFRMTFFSHRLYFFSFCLSLLSDM